MEREPQPIIRHLDNRQDIQLFKRLVKLFGQKMESRILADITKYKGWKKEEAVLDFRKRLVEKVREACLERKDGPFEAITTEVVERKKSPYTEIALLAMLCDYHCDEQLKRIESILGE